MTENHSHPVHGPTEGTPAPAGGPTEGEATVTVSTPESQVHVLFPHPVRITGSKGQPVDLHVAVFGVRAGKPTTVTGTVVEPEDPARSRRPQRLEFATLPLSVRLRVAEEWEKQVTEISSTRIDVV